MWQDTLSFTAKFLTISALLFGVNNSIACNPGEHHYVHFTDASDESSGAEAGKLGTWIVILKKYQNHQIFLDMQNAKSKNIQHRQQIASSGLLDLHFCILLIQVG